MNRQRYWVLFIAFVLIVLSWWGVLSARNGLVVRSLTSNQVPMLYIAPQQADRVPGVLVAHGYAGSKQLMLGYGYVLAHAGYAVMLWDFSSHGANTTHNTNSQSLQQDLEIATASLVAQPEVDPTRLALLGHSMGSGVVMSAAINEPLRFAATVGISPTGAAVTPDIPRNLQLQAGSWEGGFIQNAQKLLKKAGGENQNFASGKARSLNIIPNAEHITILWRNASHQAAKKWLDATFNLSSPNNYIDRRMAWYGLHLIGWLLVLGAIFPTLVTPVKHKVHPIRSAIGLIVSPLVAGGILLVLSQIINLHNLGGIMVGGAIGIWFCVAGLVWLSIITSLPRPTFKSVMVGILLFVLLWVSFGLMAQFVWLQWWLIPARLQLVPLLSLACLPWFLASGVAQQDAGLGGRFFWWFGQSLTLVLGFIFVINLLPQLSFIFLLLPVFPLLIAILTWASSGLNEIWSYAVGSALFFAWAIAAAFPLSA